MPTAPDGFRGFRPTRYPFDPPPTVPTNDVIIIEDFKDLELNYKIYNTGMVEYVGTLHCRLRDTIPMNFVGKKDLFIAQLNKTFKNVYVQMYEHGIREYDYSMSTTIQFLIQG